MNSSCKLMNYTDCSMHCHENNDETDLLDVILMYLSYIDDSHSLLVKIIQSINKPQNQFINYWNIE